MVNPRVGRPRIVRVTEIGEYLRHHSCERRFRLEVNHRAKARELPFAERLFNALDPVLQEMGRQRESEWEASLQEGGLIDTTRYAQRPEDARVAAWAEFTAAL